MNGDGALAFTLLGPTVYRRAELLRRTFLFDLQRCERCGRRRVVLAVITAPSVINAILTHLNYRPRPPPPAVNLPDSQPVKVALQVR
ncbi:MAG: hypothetical protein ACI9MR_000387 [Myxococcota bacterium]|jgi:hypothetical protein